MISIKSGLKFIVLLILLTSTVSGKAQTILYDTLSVSRNWRTKNTIILNELRIPANGEIDKSQLDKAISRVWDIGNFAQVKYQLDTLKNGNVELKILARDAFNIVPIIQFSGNLKDYRSGLGVNDHNFLGKNIELYGNYSFGTYQHSGAFRFGLPRQLLYKNMSLRTSYSFGEARRYRYEADTISRGVGYKQSQFSFDIGNPFHTDDYYTFSPNLSIRFFRHRLDYSFMDIPDLPYYESEILKYAHIIVGESIGKVYKKRHRKDGMSAGVSYSFGLGLNENSENFHQVGLSFEYHERINRLVQFSSRFSSSYSTSEEPSLLFYKGGTTIKGLRTGQISGKAVYSTYLGLNFTYYESSWFSIEHKLFLNSGQGADGLLELYTIKPYISVGTGVRFMVPMIPWLYINLYFSYSGKNRDWFFLEF